VHAGYGRIPALFGIGFGLNAGECLGIWGHNGMGKSTLLASIMGHLKVTSGKIEFAGADITTQPAHVRSRAGLGLVPQGRQIFPALTVMENLRMGSVAQVSVDAGILEEVLELFPRLRSLLARMGGQLSGGEQQLLALARCLCGRPKLVMLDEPTEGIQPSINDEIAVNLQRLRDEKKLTMIIVEQKRDFLASLTNRILVMQKGGIAREISAKQLLDTEEIH
jgi:ABC-type branched-subunit amino acid transport system ATPase component